jgi:hypothetical protein
MPNLDRTQNKEPLSRDNLTEIKEKFNSRIIRKNALTINNIKADNFDMEKAEQMSSEAQIAMDVSGGLQAMIAAQMLSIHELQQKTMAYANAMDNLELQKYYTNATIKLTNCFVQQANILAKLQGVGRQKIIVERVDVHQGAQAIVGNIQGGMGNKDKT